MSDNSKIPKRSEVSNKYKWRLTDIYSSDKPWEDDFTKIKELSIQMTDFKDTLSKSSGQLLNCLNSLSQLERLMEKTVVYAHMSSHMDTTDSHYQGLADRIDSLGNEAMSHLSFITPEILSIPDEVMNSFFQDNADLQIYKKYLSEIRRMKPHVLSFPEEQLLAMAGEITQAPQSIFNMINNADMKFPIIKDENGMDVEVTHGRYGTLMESDDRRVRKDAFNALYSTYEKQKNTIAATLSANVKANIFNSKVRKFSTTIDSFLFQDNISVEVYDNLINAIHKKMHLMHRYVSLRKKMLGLDELHMYDLATPIVKDVSIEIPYEEAVSTLKKGLVALGAEYMKDLNSGLNSGWIDVYENLGKRSGAYSWGCYDSHPYVLLNHTDNLNSVFTLAHEMGHAMHSFYTNCNQPYIYAQYKIFVAEVASTCNEALLMNYLLKTTEDKKKKLYLLNHYMDNFKGTIYRQTMFAEFEKIIHEKAENGVPLTSEVLSSIYHDLNVTYYGPDIIIDDYINIEWARIPHFYSSFYVYKYATGFSAATALSKQILEDGPGALEKYLNFLKSGGSDYPINLLQAAGVDMLTSKPIEDALVVFEGLLNEFEKLINE